MFSEIAQSYHRDLTGFAPYAPITDRDAWDALPEQWKAESVRLGEQYLHYAYPYISATDFMDFLRTGNRTRFEDKMFSKRHALNALVLAECAENKGRFLDGIINGVFSVCEESAWQLPAHNSYRRDEPQLPLPDSTEPVLDLFACETGAVLAAVYYLMKEPLDAVSPFITKRILHELDCRIFQPYLNRHFWWMGNGKEPMNNWTIWCTQNVLLSVFLTASKPKLPSDSFSDFYMRVFRKACQSTDYFLAEYGEDGCCDEGAQYYRHAGLCLFNTMEILNGITGSAFAHLYETPKIRNIASYIMNVHIDGPYYVNFADCSPVAGRAGVREFLFAARTCNEDMMRFAAQDFAEGGTDTMLLPQENNLYYRLQAAFTVQRITQYRRSHPERANHPDIYYPSVGLFSARDDTLYLAVKAGNNADSHNHNDTGSFTVYKNGMPLIIDVGVESYTKKTFSAQRYEIWTMQSAYHNLPTIGGVMQKDGETYQARDVSWKISDTACEISMDIAGAYPKEAALDSYIRRAALRKGTEIVIHDSFSTKNTVVLSLMTYEKPLPQPSPQGIRMEIGSLGNFYAESGKLLGTEEIPVTDPRLGTAWKHSLYRTLIEAADGEITMHIS